LRVLVTGAGGFVGAHLVPALRRRGDDVIAWTGHAAAGGVDVRDAGAVREAVLAAAPDAVVHLAGITHLPKVLEDPEAALAVNVQGTANVLDGVRNGAAGARVLLVSSGAVYGSPAPETLPLDETAPLLAEHPYGVQKIAVECLGDRFREDCGLDVVVARPFNHLGVGQEPRFAASWFALQIARAEEGIAPATLRVGNLEPRRDLLDVRDVVLAYLGLLDLRGAPGPFNVARGVSTRIGWILDWFLERARVPLNVESEPALFRPHDAPDLRGSPARLRAATGWEPRVPLEETLREVLEDARARARREAESARP
jgi:GDP-4-dehydro-6-deoxy-D-mannose reductase